MATIIVFALLLAAVAGPASGSKQDGLPRPAGYPDTPTVDFGPTPACYAANGVAVTCNWYGFSYILYPTLGAECNLGMRATLTNTTLVSPRDLKPYTYYYSDYYIFNTSNNDTYCLYGCFDLSATGPAPSPLAPPPVAVSPPAPPPFVTSPAPTVSSPAPDVSSPAPDVSSPAPDVSSPAPDVLAPSPVDLTTPPPAALSTPPPAVVTVPNPAVATPPTASPPAPNAQLIDVNGAGFLRPTGFVSFVLSAGLLILNGLVAF